jgi:3-oxoacyl-[acyl-carrier protein] reductase
MDLNLKNKVAIIGGSSKGIGKGCAISLAKEGVNIVLCARTESSIKTTRKEIENLGVKVLGLNVDMSSKSDNEFIVEKTIKKFGRVDILINNSGGPKPGTFFNFKENDWDNAHNDVLKYTMRMINLVTPYMKKNNWGRVINITSLSVKEPSPNLVLSNIYRAGIIALSKSISKELIKNNITINNVCPGAFKTDRAIQLITKSAKESNMSFEEMEKMKSMNYPLGRFQEINEIGDLVAFLSSENAKGLTGTSLQIDGGISNSLL